MSTNNDTPTDDTTENNTQTTLLMLGDPASAQTSITTADGRTPTCGCIGCKNDATAVIDHPRHGQRTVCSSDINGYEVIRYV